MMEFDYEVRYRKGKDNVVADALSRDANLRTLEEQDAEGFQSPEIDQKKEESKTQMTK